MKKSLRKMTKELARVNERLLKLLQKRDRLAARLAMRQEKEGAPLQDKMSGANTVSAAAPDRKPVHLSANTNGRRTLLASRSSQSEDTVIQVKNVTIGGGGHVLVAGPCSIESREQLLAAATALKQAGVRLLRGGAYKPRTSPYDFQGLGEDGLKLMKEAADRLGLVTISEVMSREQLEQAAPYIDVVQIGARNMQNFELLKAVGRTKQPILLKRGLSATLDEFIHAAEYILAGGNRRVMLVERGIRTYEKWTRNTLDISSIPILKQETHLPVLVDVSHATGRKDIMLPCAKAALAAGADGIMIEVHPEPAAALSDAQQQMDIGEFRAFWSGLRQSGLYKETEEGI